MRHRFAAALAAATVLLGGLAVAAATPVGAAAPDPVIIVAGTFSPGFANEPLAVRICAG